MVVSCWVTLSVTLRAANWNGPCSNRRRTCQHAASAEMRRVASTLRMGCRWCGEGVHTTTPLRTLVVAVGVRGNSTARRNGSFGAERNHLLRPMDGPAASAAAGVLSATRLSDAQRAGRPARGAAPPCNTVRCAFLVLVAGSSNAYVVAVCR